MGGRSRHARDQSLYDYYGSLATFDERQSDNTVAYIKAHANSRKPFFVDVNYIKMHNPTNAVPFRRRLARARHHVVPQSHSSSR